MKPPSGWEAAEKSATPVMDSFPTRIRLYDRFASIQQLNSSTVVPGNSVYTHVW